MKAKTGVTVTQVMTLTSDGSPGAVSSVQCQPGRGPSLTDNNHRVRGRGTGDSLPWRATPREHRDNNQVDTGRERWRQELWGLWEL